MAAKVLVIATDKGGDGKTTTSIFLSSDFAHNKHKRGLLVDLDPQANSSMHYLKMHRDPYALDLEKFKSPPKHPEYDSNDKSQTEWDGISSTADIFTGKDVWPYPTQIKGLDIIPAFSTPLQSVDQIRDNEIDKLVVQQLTNFINLPFIQETYEYIVIDTRPSKGALTQAALACATHLLIPCKMEYFSMDGIYGMVTMYDNEQEKRLFDSPLTLVGILPNLYENNKQHKDNLLELQTNVPDFVAPCKLKKRTAYSQLMPVDAPKTEFYQLADSNPAKQEAQKVCDYFYNKIFRDVA